MKTKLFTMLFLIFVVGTLFGQSPNWLWAKSAGGGRSDFSNDICVDSDGNTYITGSFGGSSGFGQITFGSITLTNSDINGQDLFIVKYDPSGIALWAKNAQGPGFGGSNEVGRSIAVDTYGNVYVTGYFDGQSISIGGIVFNNKGVNTRDCFIAKFNSFGNILWAKTIGGYSDEEGRSICTDINGNVFVTGYFISPTITLGNITISNVGNNSPDIFYVKYNSSGNEVWAYGAGGTQEQNSCISVDANGNSYLAMTYFYNANQGVDIGIAQYDPLGNLLYVKSAGGTVYDYVNDISTDANGNSYITGNFNSSSITFGNFTLSENNGSIFIVKYDVQGNVVWAKNHGGGRRHYFF